MNPTIYNLRILYQTKPYKKKVLYQTSINEIKSMVKVNGIIMHHNVYIYALLGWVKKQKVVQSFSASILCEGHIYKDFRKYFFLFFDLFYGSFKVIFKLL